MSVGLQVFNAGGQVRFDVVDRLTTILWETTVLGRNIPTYPASTTTFTITIPVSVDWSKCVLFVHQLDLYYGVPNYYGSDSDTAYPYCFGYYAVAYSGQTITVTVPQMSGNISKMKLRVVQYK